MLLLSIVEQTQTQTFLDVSSSKKHQQHLFEILTCDFKIENWEENFRNCFHWLIWWTVKMQNIGVIYHKFKYESVVDDKSTLKMAEDGFDIFEF